MNLSGGRTRDGGDIVGASVFYSQSHSDEDNDRTVEEDETSNDPDINKINEELKVRIRRVESRAAYRTYVQNTKETNAFDYAAGREVAVGK